MHAGIISTTLCRIQLRTGKNIILRESREGYEGGHLPLSNRNTSSGHGVVYGTTYVALILYILLVGSKLCFFHYKDRAFVVGTITF